MAIRQRQRHKQLSAQERLEHSRIQLILDFPFFGFLAMHLKLVETNKTKTASTNGKEYGYNPQFIQTLNDKELNFLTAHEVLHAALGHPWRVRGRNPVIFNIAADFVVNAMIIQFDPNGEAFQMPAHGLYDPQFAHLSVEELYDLFMSDKSDEYRLKKLKKMSILDDHKDWNESDLHESALSREIWRKRLQGAAYKSKGGSLPASVVRELASDKVAKKDWRQLLAEMVQHEVVDYGFTPPDYRYQGSEFVLPGFSETEAVVKNVVFAIDTSGSIDDELLSLFLAEVIGCLKQFNDKVKGTLIYCDNKVRAVCDVHDAQNSTPVGGSGTSFVPVFDWIEQNLQECAGLVYLTDGYGTFPERAPYYPVLWLLTDADEEWSEGEPPPFGNSAMMEREAKKCQ